MNFKKQVPKEHYYKHYDTKERWMSYWYQIHLVLETEQKEILEVGIGNGFVSDYLKKLGLKVVTVDIDPKLNPDFLCSVTELSEKFRENSFDCVLCGEVLEHLPYTYFEKALKEMYKVTRSWIVLSLPYFGINLGFSFKIPIIGKRKLSFKIPFPKKHRFDGQHYWEIGKKGYPLKRIKECISEYFEIKKYFYPQENPYHLFFTLKKH